MKCTKKSSIEKCKKFGPSKIIRSVFCLVLSVMCILSCAGISFAEVLSPDLSVFRFYINPSEPTTSDSITFIAVVKNLGNVTTKESTVSIKVGGESQAQAPRYAVPALAPGATYTAVRTMNLNIPQNYMW